MSPEVITAPTPSKRTLYCPDCWHAATPTGDWVIRPSPVGEAVVCPECGHVVTVRRGTTGVTV
ncbi:hypothetical protein [Halobaculum limi]|uniref:hypothetical protein n=1 Tax=Halobaculum limi TaxID=3031916 RepID=UPI002406D881|nr:hypothetical protein [Halobaculum sp. YSMS11]